MTEQDIQKALDEYRGHRCYQVCTAYQDLAIRCAELAREATELRAQMGFLSDAVLAYNRQEKRLVERLGDARTTLQIIGCETATVGYDYGLPRVSEMAAKCASRISETLSESR